MGIKYFFHYLRNKFNENIYRMGKGQTLAEVKDEFTEGVEIDNLMIDMNGIFHGSTQKIYQYGNCKPAKSFLRRPQNGGGGMQKQIAVFEDVCKTVEEVLRVVKPKKRLIMCVDGVAPQAKQCIVEGTLVSLENGTSIPIEDVKEGMRVIGWNGKGFTVTETRGMEFMGTKDTIKLTFFDGRTLECTPDHRILIKRGEKIMWKEAGKLSTGDSVITGFNFPEDKHDPSEKDWDLKLDTYHLYMCSEEERQKTLAFSRILGYILADGSINDPKKSISCKATFGTQIDAQIFQNDVYLLSGQRPAISSRTGDKGRIFTVCLPAEFARNIMSLEGIVTGKRVTQPMRVPNFLLKDDCPVSIIREFLGGLFGGDGHCPSFVVGRKGLGSFSSVCFSQSTSEKHKESFAEYLMSICDLLSKCGVQNCKIRNPQAHTYKDGLKIPKDVEENPRFKYTIACPTNSSFADNIGYRYSTNKSLRLSVAQAYWKQGKKIKNDRDEIVQRTIEIFDNYVPEYKCANCKREFAQRTSLVRHQRERCPVKKDTNFPITHCSIEMALKQARKEFLERDLVLHTKSLSSKQEISWVKEHGFSHSERRVRHTVSSQDFMEKTGTTHWFGDGSGSSKVTYAMDQDAEYVPYSVLPILSITETGKKKVYDIEVDDNHSFLANGICVHNCQQRKRRFMSAVEREKDSSQTFDSNSISPGTKFMDFLTKYVDWYIRKKMSEPGSLWEDIEVIFSNEKAPGEGEFKLFHWIRKHGDRNESYCIHGMDADLIMLALGTHLPKFHILREDTVDPSISFHLVDIGSLRKELGELMRWDDSKSEKKYDIESAMDDFILLCFTVGNDFLPHLPAIEIVEGGIDFMLDVYRKVCQAYGHLTKNSQENGVQFRKKALKCFLGSVSEYEKGILENKLLHKDHYFPDYCLERNAVYGEAKYTVDILAYRKDYYKTNLPDVPLEKLCHEYLEGMQWVLSYYTRGVPNWNWRYPYHYAPFSATLAEHMDTFKFPKYPVTTASVPFVQLLAILPPKSSTLLPEPLNYILTDEKSPMTRFCPEDFEIDLSGKKKEWEGTVILPVVEYEVLEKAYFQVIKRVDERERKRNVAGKSFLYKRVEKEFMFRSYYGDIISRVSTVPIEI